MTITGTSFTGATAVDFGTTPVTDINVLNDTTITANSPAGTGTVNVTVTAPGGTSATSSADQFTYTAAIAPTVTSISPNTNIGLGTISIMITGTSFIGATAVDFGTTPSTEVFVFNDTTINALVPAGTGTVDVTVTGPGGTSATSPADLFTYAITAATEEPPEITSAYKAQFTPGMFGTFTVTTTGNPTPTLSVFTGTLPPDVTFVDNGNGTATLSGTPPLDIVGFYGFTIAAVNGVGPAVQGFTVALNLAPAITSPAATTFTAGMADTFTVTTIGNFPPTLSETGALPSGVTFVDNLNGTASLAGTPAAGTAGIYPLTIAAANDVVPNATQDFTLTVAAAAPTVTGLNPNGGPAPGGNFVTITGTGFTGPRRSTSAPRRRRTSLLSAPPRSPRTPRRAPARST